MSEPAGRPQLPRVMGLRDVVLFNITAIVGLRWLTTAASQFGLAALTVWVVAMLVFFIPSAIVVRELADIDPSSGGIYCWVDRAYGPRQAFVAGWLYWVNNLLYFPSLLVTTAAIAAYAGGTRTAALGNDATFIRIVSVAGLWIAVWLNVVGLRVGKWLQNLGGIGTWIPALLFVVLAVWGLAARGSATPLQARGLLPARFDLPSINLFATMTFAFAGLELAPTLGGEIRDAAATLRRGVVVSGFAIVAVYIIGTMAMLVALPQETVSVTNGMPQAAQSLVERIATPGIAWLPAAIAILLTLGNLGGVGAWLAGSARLPFAAGVNDALPPVFAKLHPRWQTPYVSLIMMGVVATVFIVASLANSSVKSAYLLLTQTTLILFFLPYVYIFVVYLKLRRQRTRGTLLLGTLGLAAVLLSIGLGFVPPADEVHPFLYEGKVVGGVVGFTVLGLLLARRAKRAAATV
ncbi:MAG TPA: APC family permease [Gemmatimonadales bacterium]|jgi:amino acid transporter